MENKIRCAVVDDHPMMRDGIIHTLAMDGAFDVVAEGESGSDAVRIAGEHRPDVMLLDISMPDGGIIAAATILTEWPEIKVVMLTVSEDEKNVKKSLRAGAKGYLLKGVGGIELVDSVKSIHEGEICVSPELSMRMLLGVDSSGEQADDRLFHLSDREEDVLRLAAEGKSNKEIGDELDLSENTVASYMSVIFQKLGVRNRVEATLIARGVR